MKRTVVLVAVVASVIGWTVLRNPRSKPSSVSERRSFAAASPIAASASVVGGPVVIIAYGTVRSPGKITLSRPSLAEALARSVPYILSDTKKVQVQRFQEGVCVKEFVVDTTGKADSAPVDFLLENGDRVFVPEKIL